MELATHVMPTPSSIELYELLANDQRLISNTLLTYRYSLYTDNSSSKIQSITSKILVNILYVRSIYYKY